MAVAQFSSSLCIPAASAFLSQDSRMSVPARIFAFSRSGSPRFGTNFTCGSPLVVRRTYHQKALASKSTSVSVRCEQGSKDGSSLDVWLGRVAMIGFAVAISVEISTGKGLLENFGLTSPLPTVALAVTGLVGVLTAVFIFQSASDN